MWYKITDPRDGEIVGLRDSEAYWHEIQQVGRCTHTDRELRAWTIAGGSIQAVDQCRACGAKVGTPKKVADRSSLPPADLALIASDEEARQALIDSIKIKHIDLEMLGREAHRADYAAYLASDRWRQKRAKVLRRCGGICEGCAERPAVEVHHASYAHLFDELLFELVGLCGDCHRRVHDKNEQAA